MNENQILPCCEPVSPIPLRQINPPDHILVVEDDVDIRQMNVEALVRAGFQVDAAEDGAAAWQSLNSQSYDLMITDHNMPKISGLELLKKLHAVRMGLPVIMATGTVPTAEFTRCPWLQPAATLLKPYTLEELLQTVQQILRETNPPADNSQLFMYRELPAVKVAPATAAAEVWSRNAKNSVRRILAVDEDHDIRLLYADALTGAGYQVEFAADGLAAWEALQARHYDLLITEHAMPKLTGMELVRKLRAAHMALPVVMAAGRLPAHELTRNPTLQLAAVLMKPFAIDVLLDTVKFVLSANYGLTAPNSPRPNRSRALMVDNLQS